MNWSFNDKCPVCKYRKDCPIISQIEKWEKEEDLTIEFTPATFVIRDMLCKRFERSE